MIDKIIHQLPEDTYQELYNELDSGKSDNYVYLLSKYREKKKNDNEIIEELKTTQSNYYTLRSRLFDKIQQFLFHTNNHEGASLMKNVISVPYVLNNYNRETAVALLTYLEKELIRLDMQEHLTTVYSALKKLHIYSDKYYFYDQQYNKCVAYNLSHYKAEDLLEQFCKKLTEYRLSGDESIKEVMRLYIQEIINLNHLYESDFLTLILNISYLNYILFADREFVPVTGDSIEKILANCNNILAKANSFTASQQYELCISYLTFQYYHVSSLKIDEQILADLVNRGVLLLNLNLSSNPYEFFISILERKASGNNDFINIKDYLRSFPSPEPENELYFIYYYLTLACLNYTEDNIKDALMVIQNMLNHSFLKKYMRTESEIRLFHILLLLLDDKTELAESALRSITRNKETLNQLNEKARLLVDIYRKSLSSSITSKKQKDIFECFKMYSLISSNKIPFLNYIKIKEKHILQISHF